MTPHLKSSIRRTFPFAIIISAITIFYLCNRIRDHHSWKGGIIKSYGNYFVDNSDYVIAVSAEDGLLKYKVLGKDHKLLLEVKEHSSVYQTWVMYWDTATTRLWIQSSDIGMFLWERPKKGGDFEEKQITKNERDLIQSIPADLFKLFPSSDQRFCRENGYKGN